MEDKRLTYRGSVCMWSLSPPRSTASIRGAFFTTRHSCRQRKEEQYNKSLMVPGGTLSSGKW